MTKLVSPVKGMRWALYPLGSVTQWHGENYKLYMDAVKLAGHNGIDIVAPWATPLYAPEDGTIVDDKDDPKGYGIHVRLINTDVTREWTLGHMAANIVKVGQKVKAGELLGAMGNTGFVVSGNTPYWGTNPSSGTTHPGTHCHFGLRLIEKYSRVAKKDEHASGWWKYAGMTYNIRVLNYDNGTKGSVDPLPFFLPPDLMSSKVFAYASQKQAEWAWRWGEALVVMGK